MGDLLVNVRESLEQLLLLSYVAMLQIYIDHNT
jgi:hypothetical protein